MSAWLLSIEGTETGRQVALALALLAALSHAAFGAMQKGRHDPWIMRGAIDIFYGTLAIGLVFIVPFPEPHMWPILAGAWVIKRMRAEVFYPFTYTMVIIVAAKLIHDGLQGLG